MAQKKKLQVFVSSTYTDLKEERQAAVEAILTAGHIPAGMELFAAGDESQMNVIKRWIDESDVYMLILGGRYGSIEPRSQKSYIHLEYEYAVEKNKPLFAVVIDEGHLDEKARRDGLKAVEKDHSEKLQEFKELVCSKMIRFWKDPKDIKLAVMETMAEFSRREELIGWIPGNEGINTGAVAEEIARLIKENAQLKEQMATSQSNANYIGINFHEMLGLLTSTPVEKMDGFSDYFRFPPEAIEQRFQKLVYAFSDAEPNLLHFYWMLSRKFILGLAVVAFSNKTNSYKLTQKLLTLGLIEPRQVLGDVAEDRYFISDSGQQFLNRLRVVRDLAEAEKFIL